MFHTEVSNTIVEFGNKSFVEKLFFIKESFDMFGFFTDIKNRIIKLEQQVATLFHLTSADVQADAAPNVPTVATAETAPPAATEPTNAA